MFSVGESLNGKAVRSEGSSTDRGNAGKRGQDLAVSVGEQCHNVEIHMIDIVLKTAVSVQVAG
jgi:hypothetical protein